jgi:hypothetical protein
MNYGHEAQQLYDIIRFSGADKRETALKLLETKLKMANHEGRQEELQRRLDALKGGK